MNTTRFFRKYWSLILALSLLVIELLLLLGIAAFQTNYSQVVMPLFLLIEFLGLGFTVACMFLFPLPFLALLDYRIMSKKVLFSRLIAILIMISLYGIDVTATLKGYNLTGDVFVFRNTAHAAEHQHQYYLLERTYSAGDSTYPTSLLLYECDNLGINCILVYEYREYVGESTTALEYIAEENAIMLTIDDELNYIYEPH